MIKIDESALIEPDRLVPPGPWVGHIPFMSWLISTMRPDLFVELGTHSGNSYCGACQAIARAGLPTRAFAVDTWQGDEHAGNYDESVLEDLRRHHDPRFAGFSTLLRMTFDEAVAHFEDGSVDLLHIDGLHTYDAVRHDFLNWQPKLSKRAIVLFHDTNVFERDFGVNRLWTELTTQYPSIHFEHCHGLGMLLVGQDQLPELLALCEAGGENPSGMSIRALFKELGERLQSRLLLAERDGQITNLNQVVAERDRHIASLSQTVAERDGQIASLNQAVAERDGQIVSLSQAVAERDGQIASLSQAVGEIYGSTSWRMTAPLRLVKRQISRFGSAKRQLGKVRDVYRVVRRLLDEKPVLWQFKRAVHIWRREGLDGIKARIRIHHKIHQLAGQPVAIEGAIVRDRQGHYGLECHSKAYTYVEPQKPADLDAQLAGLSGSPVFSIVVPVYNTPPELLAKVLSSVHAQWYPHWQLILADDTSTAQNTRAALDSINDPRIKILRLEQNKGISGATNVGLEAAEGDFIVFMDHDDELTVDCLYELALCIARENPDFIYSDEDKITEAGDYTEPHFKPDWSPDTMMSTMYTCHVSCVRRSLLEKVGGLRSEFDGCQDWDFVLRLTEQTSHISHIPKVLYHWRIIPASTASDIGAKPYVIEASRRVREAALVRRGHQGKVEALPQLQGYFRVAYALSGTPLISIVVPTRDNEPVLRRCVDSILKRTRYRHFELVILDNGSTSPAAVAYLAELGGQAGISVIRHDAPFNFSELNNIGVRAARGEIILFLNDDTEVLQEDWLERLGGYAQLPHVGAVGAKLLYPGQRSIQHAGVLNLEDGPVHAFSQHHCDSPGYYARNLLEYNWLAVTGACLMVERGKLEAVGGFAECLPVAYNDVDLCMRLSSAGFFNVVVQAVRLVHHESVSRGYDHVDPAKLARLKREQAHLYERNPHYYQFDPFHNPNLHPNGINFEVPA